MSWLGLDIGGANLKAADGRGWASTAPFALWRDPNGLISALTVMIRKAPAADQLAVTMTGELCDCFRTKADGVRHILEAVGQAAVGKQVCVYLVDGTFVSAREACERPQLAAASNWHALARFACRYTEGRAALLIDIGSTTSDIIPLESGRPSTTSRTDTERLLTGELVYSGVGRTPVCAVTRTLPWRGRQCPVAAELFATTADAYVLLGDIPEQMDADWTADGRPLTKQYAAERIARMVCADTTTYSYREAVAAAKSIRAAQTTQLQLAVARVASSMSAPPEMVVLSGSGEFLGRSLVGKLTAGRVISLAVELGRDASSAAAAHAVAILALEAQGAVDTSHRTGGNRRKVL